MAVKSGTARPAIFLDRDGVLNEDKGYVYRKDDLVILPGVSQALVDLRHAGYLLIVISNQSGVARGYFKTSDVDVFHDEMRRRLRAQGAELDDILYCPHLDEGCDCRKPKPGLVLQAAQTHGVDLAASYLIGDKASDMECANAAGVQGLRIAPSAGDAAGAQSFASLSEAATWILKQPHR